MKLRNLNLLLLGVMITVFFSCSKFLPTVSDNLSDDMAFTQTAYQPVLGRNTLFSSNFNPGSSTVPLDFEIVGLHHISDGSDAPELTQPVAVQVWDSAYLGNETSLAQINAKRSISYQPVFSIREHAGEFIMWSSANSSFVRSAPDPGYAFDVKVSNSGGVRYFRNLTLAPFRERPYEPSIYDPVTGLAALPYVSPLFISNMIGDSSQLNLTLKDVQVYFHKDTATAKSDVNTLTFKFLDSSYHPIDPAKFNLTNWATLVHGFNMQQTSEYVRYDVAYPIPLINYPTIYTSTDGTMANTVFSYNRIGYGGFRQTATMTFDFAIYDPGNWEIDFVFPGDSPRFRNETN